MSEQDEFNDWFKREVIPTLMDKTELDEFHDWFIQQDAFILEDGDMGIDLATLIERFRNE